MDALGFVLGERASSLRVKQTKDLVHGAHTGKPVPGPAGVSMTYCGDHDEEERVYYRKISGELLISSVWLVYPEFFFFNARLTNSAV